MDPEVVGSDEFGVLWTTQLLGNYGGFQEQVYPQPLVYTPPGEKQYVYVASEMNYVYKLDAVSGAIIASRQLFIPFLVSDLVTCNDISGLVGSTVCFLSLMFLVFR